MSVTISDMPAPSLPFTQPQRACSQKGANNLETQHQHRVRENSWGRLGGGGHKSGTMCETNTQRDRNPES